MSAEPTIKFMAPLKGELAKPQVLTEGSISEWRVEMLSRWRGNSIHGFL